MFTHTIEPQIDDLTDAASAAHLDRPDVGKATIVRVLIVPAVMRILGDYNWWAPRRLRTLHRRLRLGEFGPARVEDPA